ncbi:MAG: glycoside hydrolase family 30 protein [Bacteroidales bacterium]|nr:glycoside hydrolase family 30 protein [Bacteroidales bacterium]
MRNSQLLIQPGIILQTAIILILMGGCNPRKAGEPAKSTEEKIIRSSKDIARSAVFLTARETDDRLTRKDSLLFQDASQPTENFPHIIVDYNVQFQIMEGIGGALTDASAETYYKMPPDKQDEILEAYFDSQKGIGYSFCRTHINSCDFSSESYAYADVPGDTSLVNFSIAHDLKYRIPFIKKAIEKTGGNLKLFASPWSPPAWMKTNNNMLRGGSLRPEYRKAWADYYIRFFDEYRKEGISFWGLTVQNEPLAVQTWESCIYTAGDELIFVRDFLGPRLQQSVYSGLKLMIWDHNRDIMFHRANTILGDPVAAKYVWGTAFHWYMGDHFGNVKLVHDAYPDKGLVFSEGCGYPFSMENVKDWKWGETYGTSMIHDINNFTCAWTDWNILLDETGGPNHVGNFCLAPVIGDIKTGQIHYMSSYYYIGHFSKFMQPGARRIACSTTRDELMTTAFLNPDGSIVTVIMNRTDKAIDFNLCIDRKTGGLSIPGHAIMTCIIP